MLDSGTWEGGPGGGVSTWKSVQKPIHIWWPDLVLLTKMQYLDKAFLHLPQLLPGKGWLTAPVWCYMCGTAWPWGRSLRIIRWHWYLGPIGLNQCIRVWICSSLLLSVNREEESVSKKVVVPKYLEEMLVVMLRCLPQATFCSLLVESTKMKIKQWGMV